MGNKIVLPPGVKPPAGFDRPACPMCEQAFREGEVIAQQIVKVEARGLVMRIVHAVCPEITLEQVSKPNEEVPSADEVHE